MGKKSTLVIQESEYELLCLRKKQTNNKNHQKLSCLIHLKRQTFSKLDDLAQSQNISPSTLDKWIKTYRDKGIHKFLEPKKSSRSSKIITKEIHEAIKNRLESKDNTFMGFWDAQNWIAQNYGVHIEYQWLWKYMTTKFNPKFKISSRKEITRKKSIE